MDATGLAIAGLDATLLVRHPQRPAELRVNFDPAIVKFIREALYLQRMGLPVGPEALRVAQREDRYKGRPSLTPLVGRERGVPRWNEGGLEANRVYAWSVVG